MCMVRVYIAMSLDGYIAALDGSVAWLEAYASEEFDFMGFAKTIAVTVMGRRTYDESFARGGPNPGGGRAVVMTHRPVADLPKGVEVFDGDSAELITRLKREIAEDQRKKPSEKKDIWLIGGGNSILSFHQAGLIDRWEIFIAPIMLGDGIPLFPKHAAGLAHLQLTHFKRYEKTGFLEAWYEPRR